MIKVNLLREYAAKKKKTGFQVSASHFTLYVILGAVVLAGGVGGAYFYLNDEVEKLSVRREELNLKSEQVKKLRKDIDVSKKIREDVKTRIDLMEKLKEDQTGPVQMINNIIQAIPVNPPVWLTIIDQRLDRVRITGFAVNPSKISDFMEGLSKSGFFKSVDLELMEEDKDAARFRLVCMTSKRSPTE